MNEQEAQQAQTIAEIKDKIERYGKDSSLLILAMPEALSLLEIVDSQAQKIAEQEKKIERLKQNVKDIDPEREP